MSRYSIVIPCYKSHKSIAKVVEMTIEEMSNLGIDDFEFVLVNDCSPDEGKTLAEINKLAERYPFVIAVNLGKNAGQHNAVMAGLHYTSGDYIIAMDDDMQTHPSQIKYLRAKMDEGYDIVYGYYEEKKENLFRRMGSALNHWTVCKLLGKPKWLKTSSYWIIRKYVRDYAIKYTYPNVHLQGVFLRTTDNIACVPIKHFDRQFGTSTYSLKKLVGLYLNIVTFSTTPMTLVSELGLLLAAFGFLIDFYLLIRKIINPSYATGWASIIGALSFFSGVMLVGIGVVGLYVARLMHGETQTPQFVVKEVKGEHGNQRS